MFLPTSLLLVVVSFLSSLPAVSAAPIELLAIAAADALDISLVDKLAEVGALAEVDVFSGEGTYFEVGKGACGLENTDADFIVALNTPQYGSGGNCEQYLQITNPENGRKAYATVRDECPTCSDGSLDLSPSLFEALAAGGLSEGQFSIKWHFMPKDWSPLAMLPSTVPDLAGL